MYVLDVQAALKRGLYFVIIVDSCFPFLASHFSAQTSAILPLTSKILPPVSWLAPHTSHRHLLLPSSHHPNPNLA